MSNLKAIHSAVRMPAVNKIMVVGHPLSGYQAVEQGLNHRGLQAAATSKVQGLSPTQVTEMLLRAYRVAPLTAAQALEQFKPLAPSPVWQTLALDLLLGNLEQELWGWSDPQAIYLLDYWKQLDQQLAFVLVYDSPHNTLARLLEQEEGCNQAMVDAAMGNWAAYNEALLNFYLGNTERCLLVNSAQASSQTQECLAQMKHHMGVSLTLADKDRKDQPPTDMHETRAYLTKAVLAANSKVNSLYADLQSVATLPTGQDKDKDGPLTALRALQSFVRVHRSNLQIQKMVEELKAQQQADIESLSQREAALQARVGELAGQVQQAREEGKRAAAEAEYAQVNKALEEENQMLLEELHKVQEELEQFYLENRHLKFKITQAEEKLNPRLYGAASLVKESLPYRLGATVVGCKRTIFSYLALPFKLRKIAKEFKKQNTQGLALATKKIEDYADAYQAERAQKHLSYQFGEVLVQTGSNPFRWLILPFKLTATHRSWSLMRG